MKIIGTFPNWVIIISLLLYPSVILPQGSTPGGEGPSHEKIVLKGFDGEVLTIDSKNPYSPKNTCGGCHDYARITNGYHFQQGRTNGAGTVVMSDTFDPKYPWNLSSGMYGKYGPASMDSSQLAKKTNRNPSGIDKSAFYFVQNCGVCHPGGGFGEYDRKGNPYYSEATKKFGYQVSGDDPFLDGDYTGIAMGDTSYGAPWDRSGPSEADCLLCHLKGYQWKERAATIRGRFFKYGPTVGAGWAAIKTSQEESGTPRADEVTVDYTRKEIADFDNLNQKLVRRPPDENCWSCHAISHGKKNGQPWSPETDRHKANDLGCVTCHPSDKEHNFAKGNSLQETVRDDLDNTMYSCEDCHYKGKDKKARRYSHPFSPRHMKRLSCQVCHIPFLSDPADLVYDNAPTGSTIVYDTSKFLSSDPLDPKRTIPGVNPNTWYPAIKESQGRIIPVRYLVIIYWGDLDEKTNVVRPLPLWKVREIKKHPRKEDKGEAPPEIKSNDEIKAFLKALKEKDKFGHPLADHPVLVKGGFLYQLDKKGELQKVKHDQAVPFELSLSHNVLSGSDVIGARGCGDCHSSKSPFFLRKILVDPYDEKGKPVYVEAWERLGIDKEKLDRLLTEQ